MLSTNWLNFCIIQNATYPKNKSRHNEIITDKIFSFGHKLRALAIISAYICCLLEKCSADAFQKETHTRVDPLTGFPSVNYWSLSGVASTSSVVLGEFS